MTVITVFIPTFSYAADLGIVVARFGSCDYFIADGPNGLYVLEWYGGYYPDEGDQIYGEIGSYGMVDVFYPDQSLEGSVWVEDFWESKSGAIDEIRDHC